MEPDPSILIEIVRVSMPYGRFKGRKICDLPEEYLLWMKNKGMPKGRLGELMENVLEMKVNGLYTIIQGLKERYGR